MKRGIKFWLGLQMPLMSAVVLVAQPSHAAIMWTDPQTTGIQKVDSNFWTKTKKTKSATSYLGFDENQNFLLPRNISITANNPNAVENDSFANKQTTPNNTTDLLYDWDNTKISTLPVISKDTSVSSHLIYIFPPTTYKAATATSPGVPQIRINPLATIVFDAPIIGLMGYHALINSTNNLFVPNYSTNVIPQWSGSGLEGVQWYDSDTSDYAKIIGQNKNILQLNFSSKGLDPIRVITGTKLVQTKTQPVPEPLTILGSATAIGFGAFFRNLKQKKSKLE